MTDFAVQVYQDAVAHHVAAAAKCRQIAEDIGPLDVSLGAIALEHARHHDREVDRNVALAEEARARVMAE